VMTDQTMPVLTGNQLAMRIRSVRPEIPILLCSGYFDSTSDQTMPDESSILRLMKPINMGSLLAAIHDALDGANSDSPADRSVRK
jgi:two-component system cell cycle sensor histidine kinase/response regulator CckA